jgi:RNA polymerase sigma-70 factor (ECF subfamily)
MSTNPAAMALPIHSPPGDSRDRLAALFDAHENRLYRLARRLTPRADDARDLVHDTFLRADGALASVPTGAAKEEAWLVRVLLNVRRDQWRKAAVRKRSAAALSDVLSQPASNLETSLIRKQTVWAALDQLEPRRRAIVVMHEIEGMSRQAIASVLGVSTMTVGWHLSMGRRDLKRVLANELGYTL